MPIKLVKDKNGEFNIEEIREDFPILSTKVNGKPLVYLDNAATTQKPRQVINAVADFYRGYNSNVHRSVHHLGARASEAYEAARRKVARFIGADSEKQIVFTRGTTEAINLVATGWAEPFVEEGDDVLVTRMEHHSNFVPWQQLAKRKRANFKIIELSDDFQIDLKKFEEALEGRPKIVALNFMSNVLGVLNPIHKMAEMAKAKGAHVLVDGAQALSHVGLNLASIRDIDFFAFSGHKMCGPTGIGVLWGRTEVLEQMQPVQFGGDMILEVRDDETKWNEVPMRFEAGTPNIAGVIGLGAAVDYLSSVGMDPICHYEQDLTKYALDRLLEIKGLRLIGPAKPLCRGPVFSFTVDGVHPHDLSQVMDSFGVAIRAGHHCAQPLHKGFGIPATSRASFAFYNTKSEVEALVKAIRQAQGYFKK